MYLTHEQISELTENLVGTYLTSVWNELEAMDLDPEKMTDEDWEAIHDEIFECDGCGWWCETAEAHNYAGELLCDNCADERDSKEDY